MHSAMALTARTATGTLKSKPWAAASSPATRSSRRSSMAKEGAVSSWSPSSRLSKAMAPSSVMASSRCSLRSP